MVASGVAPEDAELLVTAIREWEESGRFEGIADLVRSERPSTALAAALLGTLCDPEAAFPVVREQIETKAPGSELLAIALALRPEPETVHLLIANLGDEDERGRASMCALTLITDETFVVPEEWKDWWASNHTSLEFDEPDPEEFMERLPAAASLHGLTRLRTMLAEKSGDAALAVVLLEKVFSQQADLLSQGLRTRLPTRAREADSLLSQGRISEALSIYQELADTNPKDLRSRYLSACLLLDAGENTEAARLFGEVVATDPEITSARYLACLANRRAASPGGDWVRDAFEVLAGFDPKPELSMTGWPDPIIEALVAQTMAGAGPLHVPRERIAEVAARHPDDPRLQLGAALHSPAYDVVSKLEAIEEKFPECLPILNAGIRAGLSRLGSKKPPDELVARTIKWAEKDGDNAVPLLVLVELDSWLPPEQMNDATNPMPLDDYALERIATAVRRPRFENGEEEARKAFERLYEEDGYPFRTSLLLSNFEPTFNRLTARLVQTIQHEFESGNPRRAEAIGREALTMVERSYEAAGGLIAEVLAIGQMGFLAKALKDGFARAGEQSKEEEMNELIEGLKERRRSFSEPVHHCLAVLPVPSLHRAIVVCLATRERELRELWREIEAASIAATQPN